MAARFGVHLGNSFACLAVCRRDGKPEVVANDSGDRVTAAVLAFDGCDFEVSSSRGRAFVVDNKRLFEPDGPPDEVIEDPRNETRFEGGRYAARAADGSAGAALDERGAAAKLYRAMFGVAARAAPADEEPRAVIAVPARWTDEARREAVSAAETAGFEVLQAISEPAAALLAHDVGARDPETERCALVYRLGGISCDATLVRVAGGAYSIEASRHWKSFGGRRLTDDLVQYVAKEFHQRWKLDALESRRSADKLFRAAEECKRTLSTLNSSHLFVESLHEGVDWSQTVSRARFENAISSTLEEYIKPLKEMIAESHLNVTDIVLCGGSMKIPKLQAAIAEMLPNATVHNGMSPDEVIAIGCAKQAQLLADYPDLNICQSTKVMDCIVEPIYAQSSDRKVCLFPAGSPAYAETRVRFADAEDTHLTVFQGDNIENPLKKIEISPSICEIRAVLYDSELTVEVF